MPGTAPYRKSTSTSALTAGALAVLLAVGGCNATTPTLGGGKNTATGAAAGGTSAGANPQLEHCDTTLGTMAVDEDRDAPWYYRLTTEYKLDSTVPVLRTLIQQSNCFVVVERGAALNNMMMERDLAASGEMRQGSKMGKGQMVAADYTMSPTINFSEKGTGAVGGLLGGALGGVAGVVAGGLKA
ncbi:MAG TPA: CsgG/HfaB family protein, partial [Porticoccaceae bacterium]|nr:CsgG/HfaB family protein [Porticoccaceae bacterium]